MTLTVSFNDPDEACRWLKHMSRYRPAKRLRPEPAPAQPSAPEPEVDHRMQAILDKFHALDSSNAQLGACNAHEEPQLSTSE